MALVVVMTSLRINLERIVVKLSEDVLLMQPVNKPCKILYSQSMQLNQLFVLYLNPKLPICATYLKFLLQCS